MKIKCICEELVEIDDSYSFSAKDFLTIRDYKEKVILLCPNCGKEIILKIDLYKIGQYIKND